MYSKFLKLDKEKQMRIINAAMKEFAAKGYDNASTNEIVKEASISKGLLFHYFTNKKQLFLFLFDYAMEVFARDIYNKINIDEKDIMLKLKKITLVKLEMLSKYPEIIKFVQNALLDNSIEIKNALAERQDELIKNNYSKIFENIDVTRFKEGLDISKVINIIIWTFESFSNAELEKAKLSPAREIDYNKAFTEADVYLEIFKKSFYKE